jgi:hypothetical protein
MEADMSKKTLLLIPILYIMMISVVQASSCIPPQGFDYCQEETYTYDGLEPVTAHAQLYLTNIRGVYKNGYYVGTVFIQPWLAKGDYLYVYEDLSSWNNIVCGSEGCENPTRTLYKTDRYNLAFPGQQYTKCPVFVGYDKECNPLLNKCAWVWTGYGWLAGCNWNIKSVECYDDSDCVANTIGKRCDKSGTWQNWHCISQIPVCGNGICDTSETCTTCSQDCGICGAVCGNGICETGEQISCPADCGSQEPKIVQYAEPRVTVSESTITVDVYLENQGVTMVNTWLVELQPRAPQGLSWIGPQEACDKRYPQNVHKSFRLDSGDKVTITLISKVTSGTYDIYLLNTDKCCVDANGNPTPCQEKEPYLWGTKIKTVTVTGPQPVCPNGKCEGGEDPSNCLADCPGYCGDGYCQPDNIKNPEDNSWCSDCTDDETCGTKPQVTDWVDVSCINNKQTRNNYNCVNNQWVSFVENKDCTVATCTAYNCPYPFMYCIEGKCQPNYMNILIVVAFIAIGSLVAGGLIYKRRK